MAVRENNSIDIMVTIIMSKMAVKVHRYTLKHTRTEKIHPSKSLQKQGNWKIECRTWQEQRKFNNDDETQTMSRRTKAATEREEMRKRENKFVD